MPRPGGAGTLQVKARAGAYLLLHAATGSELRRYYREYLEQDSKRCYPSAESLLAETLLHAVTTVPQYREMIDAAEVRRDPFAALSRFPIMTKEAIQRRRSQLISEEGDLRRWHASRTGGSTGEPVELLHDNRYLAKSVAIREVYTTWAGGALGSPELHIWGSERDLTERRASPQKRFGDFLLRRRKLNCFDLSDAVIELLVTELRDSPPSLILAYVDAAHEIAQVLASRGWEVPPQRAMIATAGTLYEPMRDRLEATFGCTVFNRYGTREIGDMAGECEHGRLHVLPWSCHIEILRPNREPVAPGEEGDVVVTSFTNRPMPMIRYLIGDRARAPQSPGPCRCGRATAMLGGVAGRTVDMFLAPDGRRVDSGYFSIMVFERPWVRKFQVVQTAPDRVVYRMVSDHGVPAEDRRDITRKTKAKLGPECRVRFDEVADIEPSRSGKLRFTIRAF